MSVFAPTTVIVTPTGKLIVTLIGDALELWQGLRKGYQAVRPVTTDPGRRMTYPETTYGDIIAIVEVWERAFARDYHEDEDVWGMASSGRATSRASPRRSRAPTPRGGSRATASSGSTRPASSRRGCR